MSPSILSRLCRAGYRHPVRAAVLHSSRLVARQESKSSTLPTYCGKVRPNIKRDGTRTLRGHQPPAPVASTPPRLAGETPAEYPRRTTPVASTETETLWSFVSWLGLVALTGATLIGLIAVMIKYWSNIGAWLKAWIWNKRRLGNLVAGSIGGFAIAAMGSYLSTLIIYPSDISSFYNSSIPMIWIAAIVASYFARRPVKAWRYLFILNGLICLSLPIGAFTFGTHQSSGGFSPLVGVALSWTIAVPAFLAGGVSLIIGLLIGRDQRVIYIQAPNAPSTT